MGNEQSDQTILKLYKSKSLGNLSIYNGPLFQFSNMFRNNDWIIQLFLPIFPFVEYQKFYKIITKIGNGAFGKVYKVKKNGDDKIYALKIIKKILVIENDAAEQCKDEAYIQFMYGNFHPFILEANMIWQNLDHLFLASQYLENGELHYLWAKHKYFGENLVKIYVAEISSALDFLHQSGIIYRDVKLENLLLDQKGHIRLTDFGLSKWLNYGERTQTICGTLVYMAPEIANEIPYDHKADWWSLGIVMYAMLFGKFPLYGMQDHLEMKSMINSTNMYDHANFPTFPVCSVEAKDLIHQLLLVDESKRLCTAFQIFEHPFIKSVTAILNEKYYGKNLNNQTLLTFDNMEQWLDHSIWDFYQHKSYNMATTPNNAYENDIIENGNILANTTKNFKYKSIALEIQDNINISMNQFSKCENMHQNQNVGKNDIIKSVPTRHNPRRNKGRKLHPHNVYTNLYLQNKKFESIYGMPSNNAPYLNDYPELSPNDEFHGFDYVSADIYI